MDITATNGDSGFDAALKALEELEGNVAQHAEIVPPPTELASATPIKAIPASIAAGDDLEDALNATMATIALAADPKPPVAAVPEATAAPSVPSAPSAAPPPAKKSGRTWLLVVGIAALAVFASLLSVVGLIVTSRTVAGATLVVADARERQQQMAKVEQVLQDLERIRAQQVELLQRQQMAVATTPLSSAQFVAALDNLRIDIGKRGPDGAVIRTIHEGQLDTNQRINELSMKMMRIEAALSGARAGSLPRRQ